MYKDSDLASAPPSTDAQATFSRRSTDSSSTTAAAAPSNGASALTDSRKPGDPRTLSETSERPDKITSAPIEDVQGRGDSRGIRLECAGVTGVRYPAMAIDPTGVARPTIVNLEMSVSVPAESKGTHMSRFIEIVQNDERALNPDGMVRILKTMQSRLKANEARLVVSFPMFMEREAPVTKSKGMIDIDCGFIGTIEGDDVDLVQKVVVTVTSLCPCSKEISEYGAHNQRGALTVEVKTRRDENGQPITMPTGELIFAAEESASCRIYPVLKRPDERWITMEAYENPVFVEDMVRGVAERLMQDDRVESFKVHARNFESIHGHDAFASTSWSR